CSLLMCPLGVAVPLLGFTLSVCPQDRGVEFAHAMVSGKPGAAGCRLAPQDRVPDAGQDAVEAVMGMSTARNLRIGGEPAAVQVPPTTGPFRTSARSTTRPAIEPEFAIALDGFTKYEPAPQSAFTGPALVGSQFGTAHGLTEPT